MPSNVAPTQPPPGPIQAVGETCRDGTKTEVTPPRRPRSAAAECLAAADVVTPTWMGQQVVNDNTRLAYGGKGGYPGGGDPASQCVRRTRRPRGGGATVI